MPQIRLTEKSIDKLKAPDPSGGKCFTGTTAYWLRCSMFRRIEFQDLYRPARPPQWENPPRHGRGSK